METIGPRTIFHKNYPTYMNNCFYLKKQKPKSKKIFLMALPFLISSALAADWKSLGNSWFVDQDSAQRYGDIGVVTVRFKDAIGEVSFDCKRRLVLEPKSWVDNKPIASDNSEMSSIFNAACSKWYEIWKK